MIRKSAVAALVAAFGVHVRDHYRDAAAGPPEQDRVLEALNALAISTAVVLAGTGADPRAAAFFLEAVQAELAELIRVELDLGDRAPASPLSH
jgi:hypothetical protein